MTDLPIARTLHSLLDEAALYQRRQRLVAVPPPRSRCDMPQCRHQRFLLHDLH